MPTTLKHLKETLQNIRYVGTIENNIDRMILKGKWLIDEGEFDEESFNLNLGESFFFQSELGTSLEDSFSLPKHCIHLKGEFEMPLLNGVRKNYSESAELKITDLPSFNKECCIPIESRNIGLFGLEGHGQNHIGKFNLLGSFHPSSSRFWITKTYINSKSFKNDKEFDLYNENEHEEIGKKSLKSERLSQQMNNILNTMETLDKENNEEEQVKMSSFKSMSLLVKNVLTNMSSMMTLQTQLMSTCTELKQKIADLETQNQLMELKYENSLRIFSEKIQKNDVLKQEKCYEFGFKDLKDSKTVKLQPRSGQTHLKNIQKTLQKVVPKKAIKTYISEEEKQMLPDMIACLSEHQMIALMNKVKLENVFPVPSCQGDFEIDMNTLSEKQLLQFFILVEGVQNVLSSTLGKRDYSSFAGYNENEEEF
jgi:hypothetical protein